MITPADNSSPARPDPTQDIRFLTELVNRADTAGTDRICGKDICAAIGIPADEQADNLVRRLRNRGLIDRTPAPVRGGDSNLTFDIRPTPEAYRLVGLGLIAD